ncbi:hypothetical protein WDU94_000119 [Cyamophila willieti]
MTPRTPLTGRHYLSTRDLEYGSTGGNITPVKTATQSVSKLNLLCGRDPLPSLALTRIFQSCELSPQPMIDTVLSELGDKFTLHYSVNADSSREFAEKRVSVAVCLYYKLLESILIDEQKKPAYDLNVRSVSRTQSHARVCPRFSRSPPPDVLTLSPLPVGRNSTSGSASPFRRVSDKFGLFIRSLDHTVFPITPAGNSNTYCFTRSPAKDLQAINTMIRLDFDSATASALSSQSSTFSGILSRKRPLLQLDPPSGGPAGKKPALSGQPINKKLAALVGERQSVLHIAQSNNAGATTE